MHGAIHGYCMNFSVGGALSGHSGVWKLEIGEEMSLLKVTELGSQGAGFGA